MLTLYQESEYEYEYHTSSRNGRTVMSAQTFLHSSLHGLFRREAKESQSTCRSNIYWFSMDVAHA